MHHVSYVKDCSVSYINSKVINDILQSRSPCVMVFIDGRNALDAFIF